MCARCLQRNTVGWTAFAIVSESLAPIRLMLGSQLLAVSLVVAPQCVTLFAGLIAMPPHQRRPPAPPPRDSGRGREPAPREPAPREPAGRDRRTFVPKNRMAAREDSPIQCQTQFVSK